MLYSLRLSSPVSLQYHLRSSKFASTKATISTFMPGSLPGYGIQVTFSSQYYQISFFLPLCNKTVVYKEAHLCFSVLVI